LGKQAGTQAMIELLMLGREHGYEKLKGAINQALASGCTDAAAIKHLIDADNLAHQSVLGFDIGNLTEYERPLPQLDNYDQLLEVMG
jgi:hypothetical protein